MKKIIATFGLCVFAVCLLTSCLDDNDDLVLSNKVVITAFSINDFGKINGALYPFSIDHVGNRIYNRDSLPVGTDVSKVSVNVSFDGGAIFYTVGGEERAYSTTDSIDFTSPVIFSVYAADGSWRRNYAVSVNVHTTDMDSLVWNKVENEDFKGLGMKVEKTVYNGKKSKIPTTTYSDALNRGTRFVPWKDALSSVSVGISFDWHHGDTWGDFSDMQSFRADFTYKHIYGGVDFASCTQILYIPWGEDYWPFEKVIKDIDAWRVGIRGGYCIPLQNGYEIWSIIPYVATSVMHLHQHGATRPNFKPLDMHNHWLVGPGVKVQLAHREGIMLGAGYECQFFLDKKSPTAMSSLTFSIGKMF